jgi:hypothetical protein
MIAAHLDHDLEAYRAAAEPVIEAGYGWELVYHLTERAGLALTLWLGEAAAREHIAVDLLVQDHVLGDRAS